MKKILKWGAISLLAILLLSGAGFVVWAENALGPEQIALDALKSDNVVTVTEKAGYTSFAPVGSQPTSGFIFYPGGRVDYRSYAPVLRKIAAQGYLVVLVPVRLNLAFFDINAAEPALKDFPAIQHWAIGGHSLGGVAAAIFAGSHPRIDGIVFWASYPGDNSLKDSKLKIMSIYATRDGLATGPKIDASRALLPASALFVPIAGGDHAQFGAYGLQPGDNPASIPAEAQWQQTADATSKLLQMLAGH
jgi:pimeloyl-ACP methyl ester carboxylesterase